MTLIQNQQKHGPTGLALRDGADAGNLNIIIMIAETKDAPPKYRALGMGAPRYLRNTLEAAVMQRSGLWPAAVVQAAFETLSRLDSAASAQLDGQIWEYAVDVTGEAKQIGRRPWLADPSQPFRPRRIETRDIDYPALLRQIVDQAEEESARPELQAIWTTQANATLAGYPNGKASSGQALSALLARTAWLERQFLILAGRDDARAFRTFFDFVSARYIRALCLIDRCEKTGWAYPIFWPELTELGRTALLLQCCGWMQEARELALRAGPMLDVDADSYVPLVPLFGLGLAAGSAEIFARITRPDRDPAIAQAMAWLIENRDGSDLEGIAERLTLIAGQRSRIAGQFDDGAHTDFDDGFSWVVPYEVGAILSARQKAGLPDPGLQSPLFDLPTARFQLADGPLTQYQNLYARYIREG